MAKTKIEEFFKSLETEEQIQEQTSVSEPSTEQQQQEPVVQQEQVESQKQLVQEQQEQPLIAGKFRSVDDLISAYEELERKFYEVQERLKRAEQGLEAFKVGGMMQQPQPQPPQQEQDIDIDVDPLVDPKGFAKKLVEKVTQNVSQQIQTQIMLQQQMAAIRERFYRHNPDLIGKEKLVGLIAQDVARDMPDARLDDVLDEIARRTRQFLRSLSQNQQQKPAQPVSPTPQTMPVREKVPPQQPPELTEEQEIQEYINQRKQLLQKKKF